MLPDINLDTEDFEDIMKDARNMIASYYPEWTDYNSHDPGITLLEMFAWLKEVQQYTMNQIGEVHLKKYLKLLGIKKRNKRVAMTMVNIKTTENIQLPKGTKFYCEDICFESEKKEIIIEGDIRVCIIKDDNKYMIYNKSHLNEFANYEIYPFGEKTKISNEVYIGFTKPLTLQIPHTISIQVFKDYPIRRNKIVKGRWIPIAKIAFEYHTKNGWHSLDVIRDETYCFLEDGSINFYIRTEMERMEIQGETAYYIRMRLIENFYEIAPKWTQISMNSVLVKQKETLSESYEVNCSYILHTDKEYVVTISTYLAIIGDEMIYYRFGNYYYEVYNYTKIEKETASVDYLIPLRKSGEIVPDAICIVCYSKEFIDRKRFYESYGFPNQEYDLEDADILGSGFRIFIETKKCFFKEWKQVDDFDHSLKTDTHYVLEEETGRLKFGDGIHGLSPEGKIRIVDYVRTLGIKGNVKAKTIHKMNDRPKQIKEIMNLQNVYLGRDAESLEECFAREKKERKEIMRAVTYEDYEKFVVETPGLMIEKCKVIPTMKPSKENGVLEENTVTIAVKPYSDQCFSKINNAYISNIIAYLDVKRMIGTKIKIIPPEYVSITIFIEAKTKVNYPNAKQMIIEEIIEYFNSDSWTFGMMVSYYRLYGILDLLDCVSSISSLTIEAKGNGISRNENADVLLPPNGIVQLMDIQCI